MDKSARVTKLISDLPDRSALQVKSAHFRSIHRDARSAEALPFRAGISEPGSNTLHDATAFQRRHGSQPGDHHRAGWGARVHLLRVRDEVDTQRFERL